MDSETLTLLIQAIEGKQWYLTAGLAITVLIWFGRKLAPVVWDWIPTRFQWAPAVALAAGMAFVDGWQDGLPWAQAVFLAVYAAVSAGGIAIGGWHTVKRLAGGAPKPVTVTYEGSEYSVKPTSVVVPYDPTAPHAASEPPKGAA